jgi:hypothetical protein
MQATAMTASLLNTWNSSSGVNSPAKTSNTIAATEMTSDRHRSQTMAANTTPTRVNTMIMSFVMAKKRPDDF